MRRSAGLIVKASAAAAVLSGALAMLAEPTPDEANEPLTAVLKRDSFVFASIPDGLFRASLATRRWERLKTPPEMPMGGVFASEPGPTPLVIYVAMKSKLNPPRRGGARFGLYLSRDDGTTWGLVAERDDFGEVLLHPSGALFAVTGADGINRGSRLLRSPDLGKTWRDITGKAWGDLMNLKPDPDHPGLVRLESSSIRMCTLTADDENYKWKQARELRTIEFFSRFSSTSSSFHLYPATLSNYFQHDFGNQTQVQALEVVPSKPRFEFARGEPIVVPIRVVFRYDPAAALANWRRFRDHGHDHPKPTPPTEKFSDQPDGTDFWALHIETGETQSARLPANHRVKVTRPTSNGETTITTYEPVPVPYRIFDLSPSSPYQRELDLARLGDFSKPGEYRVQIVYDSSGIPDRAKGEWDGSFTSPVFTVVVRE